MLRARVDKSHRVSAWQSRAGWLLTLFTFVAMVFAWRDTGTADPDGAEVSDRLNIERILPLEVSPGGALAISYGGADPAGGPVRALLDKQEIEALHHADNTLVVRVPLDLHEGRASVRVVQGDIKSKKRDVWLRPFDLPRVIEMGIVGIALFVLGLRTLSRGIRAYAGNRLRLLLGLLTRGEWRSMGVGVVSGAATQSTVTTTGILVGLLTSNLLPVTMALAIILGAQLGSAAVAVAVPLGSRFSVLLVALGVIWVSLAADRHRRGLAKVLLGLGLLFFGFETIRAGFGPLVSHPSVVRIFGHAGGDLFHTLVSVLAGTLLTAILQGPGPAFAIVLGLAQSTEIVGVHQGLTILAGAPLGVALATSVVAWPFGGSPRRWAIGHLVLGTFCTLVLASTVSFWAAVADRLVPGDPNSVAYGSEGLIPAIAPHLTVGFLLSHAVVVSSVVLLLPRFGRWFETQRSRSKSVDAAISSTGSALGGAGLSGGLPSSTGLLGAESFSVAFANLQDALSGVRQMWVTGDRANASDCEGALDIAQATLTQVLSQFRRQGGEQAEASFSTGLALMNVRDALSWMQRVVERGLEWGVTPLEHEVASLERLHQLTSQALDSVRQGAQSPAAIDPDGAREREIWLNAEDNRARAHLERTREDLPLNYARHWSAVCAAYEELGNQLFHAHETLLSDADDD